MFTHQCFFKLGEISGLDFSSLIKGGFELSNCKFAFSQDIDDTGKACTEVVGGTISMTLPQLPPDVITQWALNPRQYKDGAIITLGHDETPQEKIFFENASCIDFSLEYTEAGDAYMQTQITIQAEFLTFDTGITFSNNWTKQ